MSNLKYDAMVRSGIEIVERVPIPADRIPEDARVEMDAKKAAGYYAPKLPSADRARRRQGPRADRLRRR